MVDILDRLVDLLLCSLSSLVTVYTHHIFQQQYTSLQDSQVPFIVWQTSVQAKSNNFKHPYSVILYSSLLALVALMLPSAAHLKNKIKITSRFSLSQRPSNFDVL